MKPEPPRSGALPESLRLRLVRARETYGLRRLLSCTGVAEGTHWRAEAGGTIYNITARAIAQGLDALEREAP